MPHAIWDRPGNPTKYVSDRLGITRAQLGEAHQDARDRSLAVGIREPLQVIAELGMDDAGLDPVSKGKVGFTPEGIASLSHETCRLTR